MAKTEIPQKRIELKMYRDLVLASVEYFLDKYSSLDPALNLIEHYELVKTQAEEHFQKGRLSNLKQFFRDLTEPQIESGDLKFNAYLTKRTGYEIDIFKYFFIKMEAVLEKGRITTDHQFYDMQIFADHLCQATPRNEEKIEKVNRLLLDYETKNASKIKKSSS